MEFYMNEGYDKVIIVDPGKNAVKVLVFTKTYQLIQYFVFPSKTMKKRNFADIDGGSEFQFKVVYNDQKFMVGEGIADNYNFDVTKNNEHHKLCIYTAIAHVVQKPNERVYLIVGYPSSDFTNIIQREAYLKLIHADEPVHMNVNGVDKSFELAGIAVYPEGIGFKPRMKNPHRNVHVVDIGGQNINYRHYDAQGNTLLSYSLDRAGINHLEEYVRKELRRFVNADKVSVEAINIVNAIKNKEITELDDSYLTGYEDSLEFIANTVLDFLEKNVLGQLMSKGVNLYQRGHLIIFSGGGSIILRPYLEELLENNEGNMYFSDTAQWDNCISYVIKDLTDRCKIEGRIKEAKAIGQKILIQSDDLKILDLNP
ncbi:hypothetical protein [Clostridium disporicum]|uniref:ParM/StbA family protein n=1 Tax=Clostridium disporicum TaxID=84024 RepID=UPI0034A402CB